MSDLLRYTSSVQKLITRVMLLSDKFRWGLIGVGGHCVGVRIIGLEAHSGWLLYAFEGLGGSGEVYQLKIGVTENTHTYTYKLKNLEALLKVLEEIAKEPNHLPKLDSYLWDARDEHSVRNTDFEIPYSCALGVLADHDGYIPNHISAKYSDFRYHDTDIIEENWKLHVELCIDVCKALKRATKGSSKLV